MATVRTIAVAVEARTRKFITQVAGAESALGKFGRGAAGVATKALKMGTVLAGAAAAGITAVVLSASKAIDELAKTSKAIGIATEDLQAFRLAGQLAGLSNDQFEKALKRMIKTVSDASHGLSTAERALEVLGLTTEDLIDLKAADQFRMIANAVRDAGRSTATTGAVMDIFGSRVGANLIPLLSQGAEAVDTARQEIEDMGIALSAVDAARVEAANDAFTRLKTLIVGLGQQLTVELAPDLERMIKSFTELAKEGAGAGEAIRDAWLDVKQILGGVADILKGIKLAFTAITGTTAQRKQALAEARLGAIGTSRLRNIARSNRDIQRRAAETVPSETVVAEEPYVRRTLTSSDLELIRLTRQMLAEMRKPHSIAFE